MIKTLKFLIIAGVIILLSTQKYFTEENITDSKNLSNQISIELSEVDYKKIEAKYISILENNNPRAALDILREDIKINDSLLRSCHTLTHKIGHEAYEKYNDFAESIKYKDEICNSGYLHGVIESHFSDSNDIYTTIETVCSSYKPKSFLSWECFHGVGHGIMYYTSNDLPKSVSLCETYKDNFAISSCVNGVFMENFASDNNLHPSKYLDINDMFYPCYEQKYKSDCYLYAPTFYLSQNNNDYLGALAWCKKAESEYQSVCINGVGGQAIKENINNPKLIENVCMNADKRYISSCIQGMTNLYINHYGSIEPAMEMCELLDNENQKVCKKTISLRSDFTL